jgi:acyl-CoA hydrolase
MDHLTQYKNKCRGAEDIVSEIQPGWACCIDIGVSTPLLLTEALHKKALAGETEGIRLHGLLDVQPNPIYTDAGRGILPVSWFSGSGMRRAVNEGAGDVMPCYYRDMPSLYKKYIDVDAYIATVSPMDKHGYFSTGTSSSISGALISKAKHIYLEVNSQMPRSLFGPQIHISQASALCENNAPLPLASPVEIDEASKVIGGYIADEVPNGATLQLGIGAVPEAVGIALKCKRNLGIHTELFTESMLELIACGAVTNTEKPIHKGKTVATFTFGSKRIYDFLDDNPSFEMLPVEYVNDPAVISKHPNFISVNAALEVDFYGQVCAESIGTRHISGTGGQADYVRGAVLSDGGKSFIAFPSTAKNGSVSRICSELAPGAVVTTGKNDVDCIVTEYGVAKLRGKTLSERTKALISVAHPKFREELTLRAKQRNILL